MDDSRVIVAPTFSKIFGLAGMRIGWVLDPSGRRLRVTPVWATLRAGPPLFLAIHRVVTREHRRLTAAARAGLSD